ncbi:hypothetical protein OKJ48_23910 [Streptomyces kunmingensis]|uniref:Uncharacterized protein n=1 Tax=Streptomyces kunmingensis TaxID=68225 RepID=A0ABU6CEX9_9ACTN|nr:hypothetical protein [Streptomyces kunmingensis]MEB3963264.1 hypothetical protein [Streptomyces kunmingensis]
MTSWKVAIEKNDEDGLVSEAEPDAVAHAYDVDADRLPHHVTSAYAVKPDVDWAMALQRGKRCPECADAVPPH